MSATTKLQFTLTSPGSNPTPTPSDPGTTTTPIYTTVVGSPNTGENSSAGDNFSGTVFTTLFIIIGFAALVVFLVNYLKKNRRISFAERGSFHLSSRPRVLATVSLAAAIALLGGLAITNIYNNSEKDTNAASSKELDVSTASTLTFNVDRGETSTVSDTITVDAKGAKYAQSATGEMADWIRGVKEGEAKISEYTEIVRSLKGIAVCPNCGAEVDADKPFCSSCGTKMPEIEKPDGKIPCPRCGARVPKDSRFCTACGQPLS